MKNSDDVPDPEILRLVAEYNRARGRWLRAACSRDGSEAGFTHREADAFNEAARALADVLMRCGPVLVDGYFYGATPTGIAKWKRRNRANSAKEPIS